MNYKEVSKKFSKTREKLYYLARRVEETMRSVETNKRYPFRREMILATDVVDAKIQTARLISSFGILLTIRFSDGTFIHSKIEKNIFRISFRGCLSDDVLNDRLDSMIHIMDGTFTRFNDEEFYKLPMSNKAFNKVQIEGGRYKVIETVSANTMEKLLLSLIPLRLYTAYKDKFPKIARMETMNGQAFKYTYANSYHYVDTMDSVDISEAPSDLEIICDRIGYYGSKASKILEDSLCLAKN